MASQLRPRCGQPISGKQGRAYLLGTAGTPCGKPEGHSGGHRSSAAYRKERARVDNWRERHGPLYKTWWGIKDRVFNPHNEFYMRYGGRGITLHEAWILDYELFESEILREVGPKPGGNYSLDRIDNNGDYEPGNLRWATHRQQVRNRECSLEIPGLELGRNGKYSIRIGGIETREDAILALKAAEAALGIT